MLALLGLTAMLGWGLRVAPLVAFGTWGYAVDYDEGVYFSASSLLFQGALPYRDFVFVHPPGVLYALGLVTGWIGRVDVAAAFVAARWAWATLGAVNIVLVGRLAHRWAGPFAAVLAAGLYATYPEVVVVERGPFLEPVLNALCLSMALLWLNGARSRWLAGALCGAALAVKLLAGIWLVAAMVVRRQPRERMQFLCGAAAAIVLLVAPLALLAPESFFHQVVLFHAWRPPDGELSRLARLSNLLGGPHGAVSVLALVGLVAGLARRDERTRADLRFFAVVYALCIAAFLASSSYWTQYNSHLAASEAVLAGFGGSAVLSLLRPWARPWVLAALLCVLAIEPVRLTTRMRVAEQVLTLGKIIRELVPPNECLYTFEPAWALAGGRLPSPGRTGIDPYGAMLLEAVEHGARFATADAAFLDGRSQPTLQGALESCRFVVLGPRGERQLAGETSAWFRASFVERARTGYFSLMERKQGTEKPQERLR